METEIQPYNEWRDTVNEEADTMITALGDVSAGFPTPQPQQIVQIFDVFLEREKMKKGG